MAELERLFGEAAAHFEAGRLKEAEAGLAEFQGRQPDLPEVDPFVTPILYAIPV